MGPRHWCRMIGPPTPSPQRDRSDAFSFAYPRDWALDPPVLNPGETGFALTVASFDWRALDTAGRPPESTKLDIVAFPSGLADQSNFDWGCEATDSPVVNEYGKELKRAILEFPGQDPDEAARASVIELRTESFVYCLVASYTADVPEDDSTFETILTSFAFGG